MNYQLEGLRLLSIYHYLTSKQLAYLGLTLGKYAHQSAHRIMLKNMTGRKASWLCGCCKYPVHPVKGKLPHVFYLTKKGAHKVITELNIEPELVSYPKGRPAALGDYFHRLACIDFHIETEHFISKHHGEIALFDTYFNKEGNNKSPNPADRMRSLSRVELGDTFFIPDAIFALKAPNAKQYLFALEVYNGRATKRVLQQLQKHAFLLTKGTIAEKYRLDLPWRVLSVFEDTAAMNAVINRLSNAPEVQAMADHFRFSTLDKIRVDYARNWCDLTGRKNGIFGKRCK